MAIEAIAAGTDSALTPTLIEKSKLLSAGVLPDSSEQSLVSEILSQYPVPSNDSVLKSYSGSTPYDERLTFYHFALFLTAEGAFVLMALREYMQEVLGLSDEQIVRGY